MVGEPYQVRSEGLRVVPVQRIPISPSVRLAIALCAVHLAAAMLLWLAPIPALGKAVSTLALTTSLVFFLARDAALHAGNAIVALEINDSGEILFHTRGGQWVECVLLGSSYVSPRLTIIILRPRTRSRTRRVILVPDNVDPRDFRRLRMWLRWKDAAARDAQPMAGC